MPGYNISKLVPEKQEFSITDLLKAVSARRAQMRQAAEEIISQHQLYKAGLVAVEQGNGALLDYSNLEAINNRGEEIRQLCHNLLRLQSDLRSYAHRLSEALPRATEDLLRRGNAVVFNHPTSAGVVYLLGYSEEDTSEHVVELLAAGEEPNQVIKDADRIQTTEQLLKTPELASCLYFFG